MDEAFAASAPFGWSEPNPFGGFLLITVADASIGLVISIPDPRLN
ncbi:hypothetical protein [Mesorhizobium sp. WSM1293]|nr:hypothetical protein [Mesorhizobium sp. WSM1293]